MDEKLVLEAAAGATLDRSVSPVATAVLDTAVGPGAATPIDAATPACVTADAPAAAAAGTLMLGACCAAASAVSGRTACAAGGQGMVEAVAAELAVARAAETLGETMLGCTTAGAPLEAPESTGMLGTAAAEETGLGVVLGEVLHTAELPAIP